MHFVPRWMFNDGAKFWKDMKHGTPGWVYMAIQGKAPNTLKEAAVKGKNATTALKNAILKNKGIKVTTPGATANPINVNAGEITGTGAITAATAAGVVPGATTTAAGATAAAAQAVLAGNATEAQAEAALEGAGKNATGGNGTGIDLYTNDWTAMDIVLTFQVDLPNKPAAAVVAYSIAGKEVPWVGALDNATKALLNATETGETTVEADNVTANATSGETKDLSTPTEGDKSPALREMLHKAIAALHKATKELVKAKRDKSRAKPGVHLAPKRKEVDQAKKAVKKARVALKERNAKHVIATNTTGHHATGHNDVATNGTVIAKVQRIPKGVTGEMLQRSKAFTDSYSAGLAKVLGVHKSAVKIYKVGVHNHQEKRSASLLQLAAAAPAASPAASALKSGVKSGVSSGLKSGLSTGHTKWVVVRFHVKGKDVASVSAML